MGPATGHQSQKALSYIVGLGSRKQCHGLRGAWTMCSVGGIAYMQLGLHVQTVLLFVQRVAVLVQFRQVLLGERQGWP